MILQALNRYYERSDELPREGWVRRGVDYVIVLNEQGECINLEALGEQKKGKTIPSERLVTAIGKQAMKHTNSGKDANLLWDNASFVFGTGNKGAIKLGSFIDTLKVWLGDQEDAGVTAVRKFCLHLLNHPEAVDQLMARFMVKEDFEKRDPILIFRLLSDVGPVHQRLAVRKTYETALSASKSESELRGNCLVTGEENVPLAPNESVIKGVWGGQPAGCNLVSFNARAFESYGKRERNGENAPVSVQASFAYTTALNHLLVSKQRIQVGDASTVFWAEEDHALETALPDLFGEPPKDDPGRSAGAVKALYEAIHTGQFAVGRADTRFHVLGLAPNAARIAIRFWETATAMELATRIQQHFDDLRLVHADYEPEYLSLFRLLTGVAVLGKADNIPPNLGGEVMRAIFEGLPYPAPLLTLAVQRCRADQAKKNSSTGKPVRHVSYERAAIIKACINRNIRLKNLSEKGLTMGLDKDCEDLAYRLGRLFAAYERIQSEAAERELNRSIRDTYYGAAMATPRAVFPRLDKLNGHHMRDLRRNKARPYLFIRNDQLLQEILSGMDAKEDWPIVMPLEKQGKFTLGYYHQRQEFFPTKTSTTVTEPANTPEGETK